MERNSRNMEYQVGDIVRTKKQHPCGSKLWEITRTTKGVKNNYQNREKS